MCGFYTNPYRYPAQVYAEGARDGAPQAEQVADRWHLLHNLGEAMQRLTAQHAPHLRQAAKQMQPARQATPVEPVEEVQPVRLPSSEQQRLAHREQRLTDYTQIHQLRQQGVSIQAIAEAVGVSRRTVFRLGTFDN